MKREKPLRNAEDRTDFIHLFSFSVVGEINWAEPATDHHCSVKIPFTGKVNVEVMELGIKMLGFKISLW